MAVYDGCATNVPGGALPRTRRSRSPRLFPPTHANTLFCRSCRAQFHPPSNKMNCTDGAQTPGYRDGEARLTQGEGSLGDGGVFRDATASQSISIRRRELHTCALWTLDLRRAARLPTDIYALGLQRQALHLSCCLCECAPVPCPVLCDGVLL